MQSKLLNDAPQRTYAVILETGDEVMRCLNAFAKEHNLSAARITGIGALRQATLGYFNWETKEYERIEKNEQLEVLSLVGDIATQDGKPKLHLHTVLGRRDASTCGGHLLEGIVRPTLEVLITDSPTYLQREHDPVSGLALIRIRD